MSSTRKHATAGASAKEPSGTSPHHALNRDAALEECDSTQLRGTASRRPPRQGRWATRSRPRARRGRWATVARAQAEEDGQHEVAR
eukprot:4952758-Alexandrium_andersonii.AAC.1